MRSYCTKKNNVSFTIAFTVCVYMSVQFYIDRSLELATIEKSSKFIRTLGWKS